MKLSLQAKQILEELREGAETVQDFEEKGYDQAMVNRAALELEQNSLVEIQESEETEYVLTEEGREVEEKGSPEFRLVEKIREEGSVSISDIESIPVDVALGKSRQRNWIEIEQGEARLTEKGEEVEEDSVKEKICSEDFDNELEGRGLVEQEVRVTKSLKLTDKGRELDLEDVEEDFNVEARARTPRTGKKHFYREIMDYARDVWMDMGFEEMTGNYVVPSFICMDALYIPQDHPARELQDTFFIESLPQADLSEYGEKVQNVKETHQDGWTTGSKGWGYSWEEAEAAKNILRTHTTSISAERLHRMGLEEEELPKKFYSLGRAFRNETVDRTHLAEFYQTDGIVVGKDLNFKNLKGYISEFFEKMGYDEFRLIPSYYPYTEMSVEVQVWSEEDEEWMGLGGAGMFRPEVVKPMLGFEAKVLAWGLGIGRIAMGAAELKDIRELYRNDIEILEETPVWRPDH